MKQQINRSEVLKMAHAIRRQNQFLTWGQCQAQAWKVARLRAALRTGATRFTFQKQDGEVREAYGTLNSELFQYDHKGSDRAESPTAIKYFDLEKNAWRSFRAERILQVAA
ncbi:MAG: SH3 beta-barrel fold-containing protein [Bacteroidota bacterium]